MKDVKIVDLFKAKVHFGHLKKFVCPKMSKYIYSINNKMSFINLDLTLDLLKSSIDFMKQIIKNNGVILFVGTKRQARKVIEDYSKKIDMPYVNFRWLGGILTNYKTIRKSVKKLKSLQDDINVNGLEHLTKKEKLVVNRRLTKLKLNFDGIKEMKSLPDALFVVDVNYEKTAVSEAKKLSIPVIGIVDTNSDPDNIDYVIPGNDDSVESIDFYLRFVVSSIINFKKDLV